MPQRGSVDLSGTFLPVTTPFDARSDDLDVLAFSDNLSRWFEHPVSGVLVSGSTGESVFLDDAERIAIVEAAARVAPEGRVIIAGTGAESTRNTIRLTQEAADAGADAVLVSPPAYYRGAMTVEALTLHYRAVADASPVPVLIYQVPLRLSTLDLPTELIATLSRHPNIVGIKDSRGSVDIVAELVEACASDFQVMVGSGAILYPALEAGASGGIVAVGLMATAQAAEISLAWADGRKEEAEALQERIAPVHQQIVGGMGVPGVKAALQLLGMSGGAPRHPLAPASESRVAEVREILSDAGLLTAAGVS